MIYGRFKTNLIMSKKLYFDNTVYYNVPFVFELTSLKENVGTETLTVNSGYKLVKETRAGGFDEEQTAYILSGSVPINKTKSIATLKIEASTDYHFRSSPYIETKFKDNIILLLKKVNKTPTTNKWEKTKTTNTYTFDIVYKNTSITTRSSGLIAELKYSSIKTYIRASIIDKVSSGFRFNIIPIGGITKPIKIQGQPGSTFAIAVNENELDIELKEDRSTPTGRILFDKSNSTSILDSFTANSTSVFHGKSIPVVKGTIGASGIYSFNQTYPSIPLVTSLSAAASGSHTITLTDDLSNVKVDDIFIANGLKVKPKVHSIVSLANKQIRLDQTVTLAAGTKVSFTRQRSYSIEVIEDESSPLGPKVVKSTELKQLPNIRVSFKTSTAGSTFTITHQMLSSRFIDKTTGDGLPQNPREVKLTEYTATGFSAGDDHTYSTIGKANTMARAVVQVKLKLLAAGGNAFTTTRNPVFSRTIPQSNGSGHIAVATPANAQSDGGSDWSNSLFLENKGTFIIGSKGNIILSTASVTNDTCELEISFIISKFGTEDVELELDLDKVLIVS